MDAKIVREWKKVFESDLKYICFEIKEILKTPSLVVLEGPLGAGKTTLVKCFTDGETLSPTYSILSETKSVLHGDFYRLEKSADLIHLELPLYVENKNYFFAEWGKKYFNQFERLMPENFSYYTLEIKLQPSTDEKAAPSRNYILSEVT